MVPNLERHCDSWVVVSRKTGESVMETYNRATAERINQGAYEVVTAQRWLVRVNQEIKAGTRPGR